MYDVVRFEVALQRILSTPAISSSSPADSPSKYEARVQVYKAMRYGMTAVAVKRFDFIFDDMALKTIHREIAILRKVSFDGNIVQFYGACVTDTSAMLCMEYMEV